MAEYTDDRYGRMRIHIAEERARLACGRYTREALRDHAATHGLSFPRTGIKNAIAWVMAQEGLIDADGHLRDGFPA